MPTFIGLDLAWSLKRQSGVCWLKGNTREDLRCARLDVGVRTTESLAEELTAVEGPVVATIDAPVLYTPERWVEREIGRRFGRFQAPAHSPHPHVRAGRTAGIDLGKMLVKDGYQLDPRPLLQGNRSTSSAVEVYPHSLHIRLFGLEERIPYKKKQKRSWEFCQDAIRHYQIHLRDLIDREAPGVLEHPGVENSLDPAITQSLIGVAYKRLDDTLDGLTCAIAAWLIWKEPERWEMIGDLHGYIVVPRAIEDQSTLI